jgi:CubicO group peptidase (beta-lactamase class C family)
MTNGKLTFQFTPGTRYGYSGEGFEYLARFMEKKLGIPLDINAQKLIFDPLGMRNTAFTYQPWFEGRVAFPADEMGTWLTPHFADHAVSADLVYTTANDYALLLLAVLQNRGLTPQIAKERDRIQVNLKEQLCPTIPDGLCPDALGSGLSWQIVHFGDTTVLMHTGHDPGLYTFACIFPGTRSGVVIFTNGENGKKLVPTILHDLDAPASFVDVLAATMMK